MEDFGAQQTDRWNIKKVLRPDIPKRFNESVLFSQHKERLFRSLKGEVLPPYEILIHPSSACNLRCAWCIGDHVPSEQNGQLTVASKDAPFRLPDTLCEPEAMLKLVEGIVGYSRTLVDPDTGEETTFQVENVSFSGLIGEPMVGRNALLPAMEYLVEHGKRVGIFSNCILISPDTFPTISRIGYVHFSLDASTAETYAKLKYHGTSHGKKMFHQAVENVRALVRYKRQHNNPVDINASFILYPGNFHEVYDAAVLLKEMGVECMRVKHDISGAQKLNKEQREEALRQLDRIRETLEDGTFRFVSIHDISSPGIPERNFSTCEITKLVAAVGSDGNVYPCNYHPRPNGAHFGSAVDNPFQVIWESEDRQKLRSCLPDICPATCDPFKGRSNNLLAIAQDATERLGASGFEAIAKAIADGT